jgi:hypothetical protein
MRRLFALLTALGLLGATGCTHMHGACDCDLTWGCGCCPPYAHLDDHALAAEAVPASPTAVPTTVTPVPSSEPLPPPKK